MNLEKISTNQRVMKRVVKYKKTRDWEWIAGFVAATAGMTLLMVAWWLSGWQILGEGGVLDPLQLAFENMSVVGMYWSQAVQTIIWEWPPELTLSLAALLVLLAFVMMTRRKRKLLKTELQNIKDYEKKLEH